VIDEQPTVPDHHARPQVAGLSDFQLDDSSGIAARWKHFRHLAKRERNRKSVSSE
jgi:hypothetical protein